MLIVYIKQNCLACQLLIKRLTEFNIDFQCIENNQYESVPVLQYNNNKLYPPISTHHLKQFLKSNNIINTI